MKLKYLNNYFLCIGILQREGKRIPLIYIANDHRETINAFAQIYCSTCEYDAIDFSNILQPASSITTPGMSVCRIYSWIWILPVRKEIIVKQWQNIQTLYF